MMPTTTERVSSHTARHVNEEIRRQAEERVDRVAKGGPDAIDARLAELDVEWDIERTLEAMPLACRSSALRSGRSWTAGGSCCPPSSPDSFYNTLSKAGARRSRCSGESGFGRRPRSITKGTP